MVLEQSCLFVFVFRLDVKGEKSLVLKNGFCLFSMFFVLVNFFWKILIFLSIDNANLKYPCSVRCNLSL